MNPRRRGVGCASGVFVQNAVTWLKVSTGNKNLPLPFLRNPRRIQGPHHTFFQFSNLEIS